LGSARSMNAEQYPPAELGSSRNETVRPKSTSTFDGLKIV
jgi:hypothetical protein